LNNQSRKIEIYLKDGFFVGLINASDVNTVLKAIEGHTKPSPLILEKAGKKVEGEYLEITSNLSVPLDEARTQFFHKEQIIICHKENNLF
jgi:hypothetical protein